MSEYIELFVDQGEYFSTDIMLTSDYGESFNLSSYSVVSQIRRHQLSTLPPINFNAKIFSDGNDGIIQLSLEPNVTSSLKYGRYYFDVFITGPTKSRRKKVAHGPIFVELSSTKINFEVGILSCSEFPDLFSSNGNIFGMVESRDTIEIIGNVV